MPHCSDKESWPYWVEEFRILVQMDKVVRGFIYCGVHGKQWNKGKDLPYDNPYDNFLRPLRDLAAREGVAVYSGSLHTVASLFKEMAPIFPTMS